MRRADAALYEAKEVGRNRDVYAPESMVDVTQTMACIQCGACVSDCLSMEVDPEFIGPAALAKAYRFVGDPRDGQHFERLRDLSEDPHGIYDCTHCFNCIEACPKGVAPMSQIMRLRRIAGADHHIVDDNNGHRHEQAFVSLVKQGGLLHEAELLPRRASTARAVRAGIARGELRDGLDVEQVLDALAGPLYYRGLFAHAPLDRAFVEATVDGVLAAYAP